MSDQAYPTSCLQPIHYLTGFLSYFTEETCYPSDSRRIYPFLRLVLLSAIPRYQYHGPRSARFQTQQPGTSVETTTMLAS